MDRSRRSRRLISVSVVAAMIVVAVPAIGAAATSSTDDGRAGGSAVHRRTSSTRATGALGFVASRPGGPIARPAGVPATAAPAAVARAFVDRYAGALGLAGAGSRVEVTRTGAASSGGSSVRLQQVFRGVPVMAGELVVNLDADGDLRSMNAETSPGLDPGLDTDPTVTSSEAATVAVNAAARETGVVAGDLAPADPELVIYDPRLLDTPGVQVPALTWRVEVTSPSRPDVRRLVLVDAHLGSVRFQLDLITDAKNRRICDANNVVGAQLPCTAPVRTEGGDSSSIVDVNEAYRYAGDTYDFFKQRLGRDSIDGKGMNLVSTTRYCAPFVTCPYPNAFWNGQQMTYGQGYTKALDVVAHEMSHGVTEHTSGLFYYAQSGAINESMSDVFGKFVQLTKQSVSAANRWRLGVGIPGFPAGIRNMENPPEFDDPDRMLSPNFWGSLTDRLGVHINSGVGNKAAYLIVDGATFNGTTVKGIGIPKAARIYYDVQRNFLVSGSDYVDLANGLEQACAGLVGKHKITKANCTQVKKAVKAVEMRKNPTTAPVKRAPVCAKGQTPGNLFADNFEKNPTPRWRTIGTLDTWYWNEPAVRYARSGKRNLYAFFDSSPTDAAIAMKQSVKIPAKTYLRFEHAYEIEAPESGSDTWDGAVVEYSTDGGTSWADAGSFFTNGTGYNREIAPGTNPLGTRPAFGYLSFGYGSSRLDLTSLMGTNARFRFRIGTDSFASSFYGWFIDDVRIYTCAKAPDTKITNAKVQGKKVTLTLKGSGGEGKLTFQCRIDKGNWKACKSGKSINVPSGKHTIAVRAKDIRGRLDPSPATKKVTIN